MTNELPTDIESSDRPSFDKPAFVRKHLETSQDIIPIRLNAQERAMLTELKAMLRMDMDGTAIKTAMNIAFNVLQATFGKELMNYIASPHRVRPGPK